jgi:hypothetical protein
MSMASGDLGLAAGIDGRWAVYLALGAAVAVVVLIVAAATRRLRAGGRARTLPLGGQWPAWEALIRETLRRRHRVAAEALAPIPANARLLALRRYLDAHPEQHLVLREDPPALEPGRAAAMARFEAQWATLQAAPAGGQAEAAAQLAEQLCEVLGFVLLEGRAYRSLFGYMVKAPAVRLSLPPRFPIVFIPGAAAGGERLREVRDLMRLLNATSFFGLLVAADGPDGDGDDGLADRLRRLAQGAADDLIVLGGADLAGLLLSTDPERALIECILAQIDLTVVSPYLTAGPVPENMFFGRDYEIKAILRTIRDRSFAIVGGRKIGKTSVLTQVHRLIAEDEGLAAFYLDCQHVGDYQEFFEALSAKAQLSLGAAAPDTLRRAVVRLRQRSGPGALVMLLDEVDRLLRYDMGQQTRLFRVFRALSQEGLCRFVFCGERTLHAALHDAESPLFNFCNVMRLGYLLPRDARRVVEEPMLDMGVTFEDPAGLPAEIVALSSCHPNLLQVVCQMLLVRLNARGERLVRRADLAEVGASDEFREVLMEVTWGNATPLERLISLLMADVDEFGLADVRVRLAAAGVEIGAGEMEAALDALALYSIVQRQGARYRYGATAFAQVMRASELSAGYFEGLLESWRAGRDR